MKWFVAHTKPRSEIRANDFFKKNGVESYVPVFEEKDSGLIEQKQSLHQPSLAIFFLNLKK